VKKTNYTISDCHNHLVDFLQETDGARALLEQMDRAGVEHTMINGLMVTKKWEDISPKKPSYYLDDDAKCYWYSTTDVIVATELLKLKEKERKRFHPFICGFNPTDRNAIDHVHRMVEFFPNFWQGIGEVFTRHDMLTSLTYGETGRANHVALDPIYAFAAQHNMPVSVHSNIDSIRGNKLAYLHEMEEALTRHKKTKIIWCHGGISYKIQVSNLHDHLGKMLRAHHNLYIDLSWLVYDCYVIKDGKVCLEWVHLLKQFPDRFMIGSDECGHFENYQTDIQRYYLLLDTLEPHIAKKIAQTNFLDILPK
jgi:predicted TIM-barrel fold metal-dependent hydrolase